ncbi:hypothetical protein GPECTOR_109g203 [Gonium pectorale]|uniref:Uncharacterized protein n=1 Tax=Gonium pectorale TaxID=33097 RepID=A0A150G0W8_GONPE|nr:hypothetical protein GPECTOR_109g203 [Gonium pectorale]|eukprot:KXZ42960.1 hypothetical protein GPECTOR_109g203 [Gonium pectorale]
MAGAFCSRANVTAKVGVCSNSLNFTLSKLETNILLMEEYHLYLDTTPPEVVVLSAGAWQLGNRYIAAAREALHLLPQLLDRYKHHRTFHFILTNGLGPLFEGYAASLDLLVDSAWNSVTQLRTELIALLVVPFAVWNIAVLLVYVISLIKLQGMQEPLASLNMASRVTYRYTRVRAIALAFVTADEADSKTEWRTMLSQELELMESEYGALMYGGNPSSMSKSTFRRTVPAGTFASSAFATAFFREKTCFRYEQAACFQPGHEYYEVTHHGLDVMVRRMIDEMRLLTLDADEDAVYNSTRYVFMAVVGANDLYEGLQQAAQLFVDYSISRYDEVAQIHTILLAVSVVLVLAFLVFLLWPHSRRMLRDASRQSGLLSLVPPEVDVRGHVRAVFKQLAFKGKGKKDALAAQGIVTPAGPAPPLVRL